MRCFLLILALLAVVRSADAQIDAPPRAPKDRVIVGFVERVLVFPGTFLLHAKIDTGARSSSLNAQDIVVIKRGGRTLVRFSVTNRENQTITLERMVVRYARIKDIGRRPQVRPVIRLGLCVGPIFRIIQVNLANRTGFNYQLLVGRRFMQQRIVVDPAREYTIDPSCPEVAGADIGVPAAAQNAPGPDKAK